MLFKTSQTSIKKAFEYLARMPLSKSILHKLNEVARGKCVAFFSLHRVLEDKKDFLNHPHLANHTALTKIELIKLLKQMQKTMPFVSMIEAIELLKGNKKLNKSVAVLVIEVPYALSIAILKPIIEDLKLPITIVLNTESIKHGHSPWMDEVTYLVGTTKLPYLRLDFIDRPMPLHSMSEKLNASWHLVDHLNHCSASTLKARLTQIKSALNVTVKSSISEKICSATQIEKLSLHSLISFVVGGRERLPFFNISLDDIKNEIIESYKELRLLCGNSLLPIFFYPEIFDKNRSKELISLMIDSGYIAAIGHDIGISRPGDNMFRLPKLSMSGGLKNFQQFELQGLSDAIDEFLLVTLAKEKKLP